MSEKEKELMTRLTDAVPKMSAEKQNYILGYAEAMADMREAENKEEESEVRR